MSEEWLVGMKKWLVLPAIFLFLLGGVILLRPDLIFSSPEQVALKEADIKEKYDLIVVGGDPEGVAAAVSGARNGLSTLLVDTRPVLGGLMTRGWLNSIDMNYGPNGEILNRGIFEEFYRQVGGDSFDVQAAVNVFHNMVNAEKKLDVLMSVENFEPLLDKSEIRSRVEGVRVLTVDGRILEIKAAFVIDATQDADLAAAAGAPYTVGHADLGRPEDNMAATLVFRLEGINNLDWFNIYYYLMHRDRDWNSGANWRSAWGFGKETARYKSLSSRIALRGLNVGRQDDGSVLVNALQIFGVNPLDPASREKARTLALLELPRVVDFISREVPGFKGVRLAGVAPELYIRESRHILGEYRLTIDDVLENRDFYDRVAFGSYPVDIQATGPEDKGYVVGNPLQYAVPLRSLIPRGVDNLLVVGRSASYDSLAAGSARTIPVGMAAGQSAGAAVAMALEKRISIRELAGSKRYMAQLQERLNEQGMELKPFKVRPLNVTRHWAYSGLKFMRRLGLAWGGYKNDYGLDRQMEERKFITSLSQAVKQAGANVKTYPQLWEEGNSLTVYDTAYMFCRYLGLNMNKYKAFDYLSEQGFWDEKLLERIRENNDIITVGMGYMLIEDFLEWVGYEDPAQKYVKSEGN